MDKETKVQMAQELVEIISNPEFEKFIKEIDDTPEDQRTEFAAKICNVDELIRRGIPVTKDFRITLRTFEGEKITKEFDGLSEKQIQPLDAFDSITICGSIGWIACLTVGKLQ